MLVVAVVMMMMWRWTLWRWGSTAATAVREGERSWVVCGSCGRQAGIYIESILGGGRGGLIYCRLAPRIAPLAVVGVEFSFELHRKERMPGHLSFSRQERKESGRGISQVKGLLVVGWSCVMQFLSYWYNPPVFVSELQVPCSRSTVGTLQSILQPSTAGNLLISWWYGTLWYMMVVVVVCRTSRVIGRRSSSSSSSQLSLVKQSATRITSGGEDDTDIKSKILRCTSRGAPK